MQTVEATGKNIEQAIENALLELKASREDVDIKILSEGGFLKKAKVSVSISADALDKYEKKESLKKTLAKEENDEDFAENFMKNRVKPQAEQPKTETAQKKEEPEQKKEEPESKRKVVIVADEEISPKEEKEERQEREYISCEDFVQGVLNALGLQGQIERVEDEKFVRINVVGENLNDLIGHHGECMLALSQLMNASCQSGHKKIVLNIGGYREKRAESLTSLAKRIADKVARSGRYYKFEPMDASERKIIHTALQDDERVTTLSKGEEPHRYLIVFPKEYKE